MNPLRMKLKDRLGIGLGVVLTLLTLLLVVDLQLDLGISGAHMYDGGANGIARRAYRKSRLINVFTRDDRDADVSSTEQFWQRYSAKEPSIYDHISPNDHFDDLKAIVNRAGKGDSSVASRSDGSPAAVRSAAQRVNPTLGDLLHLQLSRKPSNLEKFHFNISRDEMYSEANADNIVALLHDLATMKVRKMTQKDGGTQLKLTIQYDKDIKALFKPMRFARHHQTLPNHYYFSDYERHTAEIAAFHLDRLLGYRRAMPVVGRKLNITTEIMAFADDEMRHTSFVSPVGNQCFYGRCSYYCDSNHAICGDPDMLEGSLAAFLPLYEGASRRVWRHPWRRSYNKKKLADWETDDQYCDMVRVMDGYDHGRRLLDIMDMSVFDFLTGNMDRHHYETFEAFGGNTFTVHLDHGRAFGKAYHDEMSILAPIKQCCMIRAVTLRRLLQFNSGATPLSQLMEQAMANDPIAPVLWQPHLTALDRRVVIILNEIRNCLEKTSEPGDVIITNDDNYV